MSKSKLHSLERNTLTKLFPNSPALVNSALNITLGVIVPQSEKNNLRSILEGEIGNKLMEAFHTYPLGEQDILRVFWNSIFSSLLVEGRSDNLSTPSYDQDKMNRNYLDISGDGSLEEPMPDFLEGEESYEGLQESMRKMSQKMINANNPISNETRLQGLMKFSSSELSGTLRNWERVLTRGPNHKKLTF